MAALIADSRLERDLIAERRAAGADRWDEVWDGVYILVPLPNLEHQEIVGRLVAILQLIVGLTGHTKVYPGVNVSDREEDWNSNYRCPDVAVYLQGTTAENRGTQWLGRPDFAVAVVSEDDRVWDKLPFYESVGVRELLIVDREPWGLELYRRLDGRLQLVARSTLDAPERLRSDVAPLAFRLQPGAERPAIEVSRADGTESWTV